METKTTKNDRILSYKMSYKLTEEDLDNVSAAGTSCRSNSACYDSRTHQADVNIDSMNNDD
jgi:hypothetical protein